MLRRGVISGLLALAPLSLSGAALAQPVPAPRNNFDAALNGMASLCPSLVAGGPIPDEQASAPFGLRPILSPAGQHRFQSLFDDGVLQVHFEPAQRMCAVHYDGPGFPAVAGVARDLAVENGFTRVTGGVRDGIQGEVFQRRLTDPARQQRYIVIESPTSQHASVGYFERITP